MSDDIETDNPIDVNRNYFYLGGVLAHIFDERLHEKKYGYKGEDSFSQFCEEQFGFKARKAHYWIDIYRNFSRLENFDEKKLGKIGWSKAALLGGYVTDDNVDELVKTAEKETVSELKETLKVDYVSDGKTPSGRSASRTSNKIKRVTFTHQLFEDQAEGVSMILDSAKKQLGIEDPNQVFEHIVNEWAADHLSGATVTKAKRAWNLLRAIGRA